jgi:hypothetical protein
MLNHIRSSLLVTFVLLFVQVPGASAEGLRGLNEAAAPVPNPSPVSELLASETDSYDKVVLEPQRRLWGRCTESSWWWC